jgi:sucrose-6F-phosphate phosphohydrolase
MDAILFVSDLDNTLVGNDPALAQLNQQLTHHRETYGTKVVYATGRSRTLYLQLLDEKPLISPDALICAVGTEMYFNPTEDDTFDSEWAKVLSPGWDRDRVVAIAAHFADLVPQQDSEQGAFKVSYHLTEQAAQEVVPHLQSALAENELDTKLIYSASKDLDILPKNADKGLAVQHLQQRWAMTNVPTVVCGDSGNDIALFTVPDAKGIVVGNAQSELRQWSQKNKADALYLAQEPCAGGILEGLEYFGLIEFPRP